jgi:UDPglucose 6-dehydrogenase
VRVAVWGLAFKPNTDDMRESPALELVEAILDAGGSVCAHDPEAMREARRRLGERISYADGMYDALRDASALVVVTEWNAYRNPDFDRIRASLRRPVIIDGRNLYDAPRVRAQGFVYDAIGKSAPRSGDAGKVRA